MAKQESKFGKLTNKLEAQGQPPAAAQKIAATVGRKKYGNAAMAAKAKAGKKKC